jgi:hypothetical protein
MAAAAQAERMLLIKAKGGLGNRMLSAISGLVFADLTGRTPLIDWRDGSYAPLGRNAWPLLFEGPQTRPVETFDAWPGPVSPAIWTGHLGLTPEAMVNRFDPARHASATVYRRFCTDLARLDAPEEIAVFWCYLPKFGRLRRHMRRDPRFAGRPLAAILGDYLDRWFRPNARVRAAVAALRADLPRPLIGVHVRHTDRRIPLAPIKAALRRRLAAQPGATVFLATDNAAVQAEMASEFAGVRFTDKHLNPDGSRLHWPSSDIAKVDEAENALIDMHLLAGADHLICSRHSTFAIAAELIGRLPAARVDDIDARNLRVVLKRIVQDYI